MELRAGEKTCMLCDKEFKEGYNLRMHLIKIHKVDAKFSDALNEKQFQCPDCQSGYTEKTSLRRHVRNVHGTLKIEEEQTPGLTGSYRCSLCNYTADQRDTLSDHYGSTHPECGVTKKRLTFSSEAEFKEYKRSLEDAQGSSFSLQTCRTTETTVYKYYKCSREANRKSDGNIRTTHNHSMITTCSAYIKMRSTSSGVIVDVVEAHVHNLDPPKLLITSEIKEESADADQDVIETGRDTIEHSEQTNQRPTAECFAELAALQNLVSAINKKAIDDAEKEEMGLIREATLILGQLATNYGIRFPDSQPKRGRSGKLAQNQVAEEMHVVKRSKSTEDAS